MALTSPRFSGNARIQEAATKGKKALMKPEKSDAVGLLQQALYDLDYPMPVTFKTGNPDKIFGDETHKTVYQFQVDEKLSMKDGKAGNETLTRLDEKFQAPPAPPPTPTPPLTQRKSVFELTDAEEKLYVWCVYQLIYNPSRYGARPYADFVNYHRNMGYFMHSRYVDNNAPAGMFHPQGVCRFLPWHRVFTRKLEIELQKVDRRAFVPYWHWNSSRDAARGYPAFLDRFIGWSFAVPAVSGSVGAMNVTIERDVNGDGKAALLMASQETLAIQQLDNYLDFTQRLETGPHNRIHNWCGRRATMGQNFSPADPIFFTHHAEVDRQWALWQDAHPGLNPPWHPMPPGPRYGEWNSLPAEMSMTPFDQPNGPAFYLDIRSAGYGYAPNPP